MKIRDRLTLLFTAITAAILLMFASLIYITASRNREAEFYASLKKEAVTKANLFLNAPVDAGTLQLIYRNNREVLNEVEVAIYDTSFTLYYHDALDIDFVKETPQMISEVQKRQQLQFDQDGWQVVALVYRFRGKPYIVTATAYDRHGYAKLYSLRKSIILVFILSVLLMYVAGRFFSKRAFASVKRMTDRVNEITATSLNLRVHSEGNRDEISLLADTFNEMLHRLETSFDTQKQFVSNISHELRTPLAAIITELELSGNKDRSVAEYKTVIRNALGDAHRLTKLCNSLLDLAKASYDASEITFREIRLDEMLLDAQRQVTHLNPDYQISIRFGSDLPETAGSIDGNEYLVGTAFANLMENACKFSPAKHCEVSIFYGTGRVEIRFADEGIGIPAADLPYVFEPFYRGANRQYAAGNGIGLSLTQKIIALHRGSITVRSTEGEGTVFSVEFMLKNES